MKYPCRARILDVTGQYIPTKDGHALALRTPDESRAHIGKMGTAERKRGNVRITLDDGTVLWGYECWWEPVA